MTNELCRRPVTLHRLKALDLALTLPLIGNWPDDHLQKLEELLAVISLRTE